MSRSSIFRKAFASVADQGTLSGANFLMNVLLARWLTPIEYGAFAVAWSVCLIFVALHNALIVEPLTVVGPAEYGSRLGGYFRGVGRLNRRLILLLGIAMEAAALCSRNPQARMTLAAFGVALPGYLLLLTARRKQYILDRPVRAFYLSCAYAAALLLFLVALHISGKLSVLTAVFCLMVSLPTALLGMRPDNRPDWQPQPDSFRQVARDHWKYGKWIVAATFLGIGIPDLQVLLLSRLVDLQSAGYLRALVNLISPLAQLVTALSVFAMPRLARSLKDRGPGVGLRRALLFPIFVTVAAACYLIVLLAFGGPIEHILYGGRLAAALPFLPWVAGAALLSAIGTGFTAVLRAAQNSWHTLLAGGAATVTGLAVSYVLIPMWGWQGALIGMLAANAASMICMIAVYLWLLGRHPRAIPQRRGNLTIFDENLISTSPVGSCLLRVVDEMSTFESVHVFYNQLEAGNREVLSKTHIPLPRGPVVLRAVLFTLLSGCAYLFNGRGEGRFNIAAQGVFPFGDLSYAQFCHRVYLRDHRASIGGKFWRRTARFLTHIWGALTESVAFGTARAIVVPSEGMAREISAAYPRKAAGKIRVIPNPVDTEGYKRPSDFDRTAWREKLGCGSGGFLLVFCALGNFERKGLRYVLEALATLREWPVKLAVVGGTPGEIREHETLCERLGISNAIHFTGLQRDVRPYLWAADAFVFPSIYEAFSLACSQAAAAGLPLITTKIHGVEEFMTDGATGWFIERDAASIAEAICKAVTNRPLTEAMGAEARRRVAIYNESAFRERWRTLLASLRNEPV